MSTSSFASQRVGDLVRGHQDRARVFERLGIDYCCGGEKSLAEACFETGQDVQSVCRDLEEYDALYPAENQVDWATAPLGDLIDHILYRHHRYLRERLPHLANLLDRTIKAHADRHPELIELRKLLTALSAELFSHMAKEENVLFPIVKQMQQAVESGRPMPPMHCGNIHNPISVMEEEHTSVGVALRRIRWLTGQYETPEDACATYRALIAGLADLEADLHLHIHKENNIVFPRAAELAATLGG